jgi:hypothetical protein
MWDTLSSLAPLRRGVKLGWRACCGFASVHRLPRPTARLLHFGYSSTAGRASSSYVLAASSWVWNGMMVLLGAARVGPRRNTSDPPRRLHLQRMQQLRLSKCMRLLSHPPLSDVCEPSLSKGVERRGGVSPSAELAAAGRWSYGNNERCVGDLATVLLHSCVRPAPSAGSNRVEGAAATMAVVDG